MTEDTSDEPSYIKNDTKMERLFADTIAAAVVLSLPLFIGAVLVGFMGATTAGVGAIWLTLYSTVVIMGAVRLFGKGALSAAKDVVGGNSR
jgi:fatty-acid desaturase